MNLDEAQKQKVRQWIGEGQKLSEIQNGIEKEFGLRVTYMEVRFLVDDLKLSPKDPPPAPKPVQSPLDKAINGKSAEPAPASEDEIDETAPPASGRVSLTVDQVARAGALVSGSVTFSDGRATTWLLDQMGRLGLGKMSGPNPPAEDLQEFQMLLQQELSKYGA